ncbi:MAG: microcin C ABC transporter permease YejB [Alphaproteobacteria bacterium]|nr:microcin C ABC transporter permease YejB [Alphaproteobacteria bacterium]
MAIYLVRRLFLVVPTLFLIFLINFAVLQFLPGGPVEQYISRLEGIQGGIVGRVTGGGGGADVLEDLSGGAGVDIAGGGGEGAAAGRYRGAQGLPPEFLAELERRFGLDLPLHQRFARTLVNYLKLDFGDSFFRNRPVVDLIIEKLPVSISLGLWSTLIIYLVCIPLGIAKAVRDGTRFDLSTSIIINVAYAIPGFLLGLLLIVVFASGQFVSWFPIRGLTSDNFDDLSAAGKALDYLHHIILPVISLSIGGFAGLTLLTKNSFLDQIRRQYVVTARARGLSERRVLYGHVFRNAMLIVIAGFPATLISLLFTGSVLIETLFSLDGLGLLGFEAAFQRDYPIVLGSLYVFTLIGLLLGIIADLTYTWVDPRIDFESRDI